MKFTIEKSVLQNAVLISARAVPSKSPISALEGLLIEAGTAITVTGYDLKKQSIPPSMQMLMNRALW